ncbi:MAG: hypothetical protein IKH10_02090 [Bacteroidetes bacterium]|nr:hypothetical protein [Bacteroidota bacterium]
MSKLKRKFLVVCLFCFSFLLVMSCSDKNDNPVDSGSDKVEQYMAIGNTATFAQTGFENVLGVDVPIPDSNYSLTRNILSTENKNYKYQFVDAATGKVVRTNTLTISGSQILSDLNLDLNVMGAGINLAIPNFPLLDLNTVESKNLLDSTIKYKLDASTLMQGIPAGTIMINIDIQLTSKLINNGAKTFALNGENIEVVSYTTENKFTATINDPLAQQFMPEYNNKLVASGSYENENYFSAKNHLGIVQQTEKYLIHNELIGADIMNQKIVRKMVSYTEK